MTDDFRLAPVDPVAAKRLAAVGLRYELVDTQGQVYGQESPANAPYDAWTQAAWRGFHSELIDEKKLAMFRAALGYRRTVGVYDDAQPGEEPAQWPVGTVASWPGELTVPGERTLPAWAISAVSVAPTHAGRGIARALLEGELRTAASLGVPMAMLTVSESTLYERYGFAPAAMAADYRIETRRGRWVGPIPSGSLQFITTRQFRDEVEERFASWRLLSPGQMEMWGGRWDQFSGYGGEENEWRKFRAVRYLDEGEATRGLAVYQVKESGDDFTKHTLEVRYLLTETVDAYAALWRFLLTQPLVGEVKAELRSIDEPVRWMWSDWRAFTVTTTDHLWLRVLDIAASFAGRGYVAEGRLGLEIADSLGFVDGRWLLDVSASGDAVVTAVDDLPDGVAALGMDVSSLSALYLGGVAATTLVDAGRVRELTPGAATAADSLLRSPRMPWLSVWF
jgi:predicted acetyltransferase